MTKGFTKVRVGHAAAHNHLEVAHAKRDTCTTGGFYKSPAAGDKVDSNSPLNIAWDTSCLTTKAVDIYLFQPSASVPRIHVWQNVNYATGTYSPDLLPRWWNATATASLQLSILPAGQPIFMQSLPAAPIWTATYEAPTTGTTVDAAANTAIHDSGTENVDNFGATKKVSSGGIAAAVLLPLIAIAGLVAFAWIKYTRKKGKEDRRRYSEAVGRRMSTISRDWNSITPAGATAAIRQSMAFPGVVGGVGVGASGNRDSAYSFGTVRASEDNRAGIGARAAGQDMAEVESPPAARLRPGLRQSAFTAERQSRVVSFAEQPRPSQDRRSMVSGRTSQDTRRTVTSRAFHDGFVPPLPTRMDSTTSDSTSTSTPAGAMSPTQTEGAFTLTAEDIRVRLAQQPNSAPPRPSMDEMMPALSLMRQGGAGDAADDNLLPPAAPATPSPPVPSHQAGTIERSPIMGVMPMQSLPQAVGSPDDLLRAYAAKRATGTPGTPTSGGMRVLYAPPTPSTPALSVNNPYRNTIVSEGSRYSVAQDENPYGGVAGGNGY